MAISDSTTSSLISPVLHSFSEACKIRRSKEDKKIVLTNGCFDLLHAGHVYSLEEASKLGDELWVALNSDNSIRNLKGPDRPIYNQRQRAYLLGSLSFVSLIFIFDHSDLATEIKGIRPHCYVKSGDYTLDKLNSSEHDALKEVCAKIVFVPFIGGMSTSNTIESIKSCSRT